MKRKGLSKIILTYILTCSLLMCSMFSSVSAAENIVDPELNLIEKNNEELGSDQDLTGDLLPAADILGEYDKNLDESEGQTERYVPDLVIPDEDLSEPYLSPYDQYTADLCDDVIVSEIPEKRSAAEKHFRLNNGALAAAVYTYEINEQDENDCWQEIDNTLSEVTDEAGRACYARTGLHDTISFSEAPEKGRFLEITSESGSFSWGLEGLGKDRVSDATEGESQADPFSDIQAVYTKASAEEGYEKLLPKSAGGEVRYEDLLASTDLSYWLFGNTIKENLILKSEAAADALLDADGGYAFKLRAKGFTVCQTDEQTISLHDSEGTEVYRFSAPCMTDAGGGYSADLALTLESDPENEEEYNVFLIPDGSWLTSPERVYPITIDPSIVYSENSYGFITSSSAYSASPNATETGNLSVGRNMAQENLRAVFKINSLPALTEADTVIDARISFVCWSYSAWSSNHTGPVTVNLHPLTSQVNVSGITWNTLSGHFSPTVTDSETIAYGDVTDTTWQRVTWDITKTVKDWYLTGNNYGMAMISENESENSIRYVMFISANNSNPENIRPAFTLTYLNQEGLESYLTYHSAGSDDMGILSVGDFNGNLIYTYDDISMTGAYLPITISHVFNTSKRNTDNVVNTSMHLGKGFRLNLTQRIEACSLTGYPYTYTDADGTVHCFTLKSGTSGQPGSVYEKEFETTTKLTKTSSGFTLTTGGDLSYTFNSDGFLTTVTDIKNGKTQTLTWSSGKLTKVTDGANRQVTLSYDADGYLTSITDPAGRAAAYTYTAQGRLKTITKPDGRVITLSYTSINSSYYLSKVQAPDGCSINVSYTDQSPARVTALLEKNPNGSEGKRLQFTYNAGETTVTDRDSRSETMMFDVSGHTVCIKDNEGNAVFGDYKNSDDNKKHALLYSSVLQGSITNHLKNHDFEKSLSGTWSASNASNTQGSFAVTTEEVKEGNQSLKLISTGTASNYGILQSVTLPGIRGKSVTLSAYVKQDTYDPTETRGLKFSIRYTNASGNTASITSAPLRKISGWHRFSFTAEIPSDALSDTVRAVILLSGIEAVVYIDSVQLEEGESLNRYNLLENGHFREETGNTAPGYWSKGSAIDTACDNVTAGHNGNGYTIQGNSQGNKMIWQNVPICNGKTGDCYVFSAFAKADAIPQKGLYKNNDRYFAVRIRFYKADDTYTETYYAFEAKSPEWQYLSGTVTAPHNYVSLRYALFYSYQKNAAVFDDACLYRERYGEKLTYDDEGRVTKSTTQSGLTTGYTYVTSGRPEISKVTYPDGTYTNYTYDQTNWRLLSLTDASGKTVTYTYDSNGNATKASTTVNGKTIRSDTLTYSGGYVNTGTDPFGNTTTYSYTQNKGLLNTLTNAKNVSTSYTYNSSNDLLTKVQTGSSKVSYTYTNNRLTGLTHNTTASASGDVTYNLSYNTFGRETGISVGNQSLVTYSYNTNNGDLKKTTYGNSQSVTPVYDALGRVIKVKYNNTDAVSYSYAANGKVGMEKDLLQNITTRYSYDNKGRLYEEETSEGERKSYYYNTSTGELSSVYIYPSDGSSRILNQYTYGSYNGTSGERLLTGISLQGGGVRIDYSYDDFYRKGKTVTCNNGASQETSYTYKAGTGTNMTSLLPKSITNTVTDTDHNTVSTQTLNYTYDSLGNIETVKEGSTLKLKYYYDDLNQLIREDNAYISKTVTYTYDLGGNIKSSKEYAYTTAATVSGTPTVTNTYTYGDSGWKDKLTSYNGNSITYDAIGNPLSYYNGYSFTWAKGRQLQNASNGTDSISYTYNTDGYRTSKTVNGNTYHYTLDGSHVVYETGGDEDLWFYYDENGEPVGMKRGSYRYIYRKNLQGDITGIVKAGTGQLMVSYKYDAWGKATATNVLGTTACDNLIHDNPYLYRGYRYDRETGLYYLNSRYYDPETGRFINADDDEFLGVDENTLSYNLFIYCANNPINLLDEEGTRPSWTPVLTAITIVAVVVAVAAVCVATGGTAMIAGTSIATAALSTTALEVAEVSTTVAIVSQGLNMTSNLIDNAVVTIADYRHEKADSLSFSKGHQGNMRDSGLRDLSDLDIEERLRELKLPNLERQRLIREQKARGLRNARKRREYKRKK